MQRETKELLHCGNCAFTASNPSTLHYHRQFMGHFAKRRSDNVLSGQSASSNGASTSASLSSGSESIEETEGWFEMESIELDDSCAQTEELRAAEMAVTEVKEMTEASSTNTTVIKDTARLQCPICRVPSSSRRNLRRHMLVHIKQRPVICAVCGKGVRDTSSLKRHMLVHSDERPFGCTLCTSRFKLRYDLTKHTRKNHKQAIWNAPRHTSVLTVIPQVVHRQGIELDDDYIGEGQSFPTKSAVTEVKGEIGASNSKTASTESTAKNIKRHQCPICGVPSTSKLNLERHMLTHTRQRPLTCAVCGKGIRDLSSLKRHMMLVHSDERPFGCTLCTSTFKLRWELNKHTKTVHAQTAEKAPGRGNVQRFAVDRFDCKICLRTYPTRKRLRSHMLVHTKHKRVLCATCGNSCRDKDALKRHMPLHSGERPFACSECDFTAKDRYSLTLHQRRHTGELFKCPHCDYANPLKSKLDRHSKVHANKQ